MGNTKKERRSNAKAACKNAGKSSQRTAKKKKPAKQLAFKTIQAKALLKEQAWQDEFLQIKVSTIPNAGNGVFAKKLIPAKTIMGYYRGRKFHQDTRTNKRHFNYFMELTRRPSWISQSDWINKGHPVHVDGTNILSLVNCCKENTSCQNATFAASGKFTTTKDIQPDQEIFIYYGHEYWENI